MSNPKGNIKHGGHGTLTYARWKSMMQRCNNPNATNYWMYGGNGISVCERWHDYASFLTDMGECPHHSLTMDRINPRLGYEPGNCRWADKKTQSANRPGFTRLIVYNGVTRSVTEWAEHLGVAPNSLAMRIRLGWSIDRAMTQPFKSRTVKR